MKVRYRGTFEATRMPKCGDETISEKWLVIQEDGSPAYFGQDDFDKTFELARKPRKSDG